MADATPPSPTPLTPPGGPKTLFLFDGNNFVYRAYHALPMLNAPDGRPVNAVHGFVRMVQATRRDFGPERVAAVFDAGGDGGRREIYEDYKANRSPPPDDLAPQFPIVRAAVDALGIRRIEQVGWEADDVIASYARRAVEQGISVVIVSSDKDLMQLVTMPEDGPSILLYDTMKQQVLGPPEVLAKFGVTPEKLGDLLALTGDSSDNIPGVPGIGPKTASALLDEFGDLEGVLAGAPTLKQKKRRERLIENADDARLSRRLVELHTEIELSVPLDELVDPGPDEDELVAFFEPLGFRQVLRELGATAAAREGVARQAAAADDRPLLELAPVGGFAAVAPRVLTPADVEALRAVVDQAQSQSHIGLSLLADGSDPQTAGLVGIGLFVPGVDAPVYLPVGHRQVELGGGGQWSPEELTEHLGPLLADPQRVKGVHDAKAAVHLLAGLGLTLQGADVDAMLASYTLDPARASHALAALSLDVLEHKAPTQEAVCGKGKKATAPADLPVDKAGAWVGEQAQVCAALGDALHAQVERAGTAAQRLFHEIEMPLWHILVGLERRGIAVDSEVLRAQAAELGEKIAAIEAEVETEAGYRVNLDSPIQLRKLLFEERGLPATRKTKTGYSTDAKVLEELSLLDPIVGHILEYRSLTKLKGTYLDTLPELVSPEDGRLRATFQQAVAATGRLSSSDPNIQNIPIRTAEGRRIREGFVAPPGRMLVALDYSQIELRVLAHLSKDPALCGAFADGVDVHRRTAAEVFDVPEAEVDSEQRRIAKAVNFGVVYGQTAFGLAQQLGIPRGKAGSYIRAYFEKVPGVKRYMDDLVAEAKRIGYAETILGRRRRIPELARKGPARGHGERIARNTPIQGSAADILKIAMIEVDRGLADAPWADMLLTVHDELIFECDEDRVDDLVALARPRMESAAQLDVPLQVDAGHGRTWAACKG